MSSQIQNESDAVDPGASNSLSAACSAWKCSFVALASPKRDQRPADTPSHGGELLWGEGFVARLPVFCSVRGARALATPGDVPSAAGVLLSSREFLSASVGTRRDLCAECFK